MRAVRQGHVAELRRKRQRRQYRREVFGRGVVGVEYTERALDALEAAGYLDPDSRTKSAIARAITQMLAEL